MKELTIEATPENVDKVIEFIDGMLEEYGCGVKEQMAIDVAVDELFSNIAHYAYNPETGYATVRVDVKKDPLFPEIERMAFKVNEVLKAFFLKLNVRLIDFKLEFGRLSDGSLVLADEISPDTCRFWDATTGEKLDKDRFRRDLGGTEDAYNEMMRRVFGD